MTDKERKSCIHTIELLRRIAFNVHGVMDVIDAENCDKIIKMLEQPTAQQWIPCSERLPEKEYVLISKKRKNYFDDGQCIAIAIRIADARSGKINWRDTNFGVVPDDNVLAWMPLPEPWKGEQK